MTRTAWLGLVFVFVLIACGPTNEPQTGSQTNWLTACSSSSECGELECLCGVCTATCSSDDACAGLSGGRCMSPSDDASIEQCGEQSPAESLCLPSLADAVHVAIDTNERHQELVGFGASLAFADDAIVVRPDKAALFDLVFADAGLSAIRLRNRFADDGLAPLEPAREIVAAAEARIGRAPFLFMTSGTPPAELKANASRRCAGDVEACTLRSLPDGGFDYEGFARFWRDSLDAYASAGLAPDYVSIQNNPNWVPGPERPGEACRFLPEEGTASVEIGGVTRDLAYPGYREALAAVRAALTGMAALPGLAAPEATGPRVLGDYALATGAPSFEAIALHLYGQDPAAVDVATLDSVAALSSEMDRPVFQTEMQAEGLETAILAHYALTRANAAAYLQNDLVALTPDQASVSLVLLTDHGLEPQGPYYALMHFAKHTARGFVRVGALSDSSDVLASAWLSPDERALTVVLINPGEQGREVQLELDDHDAARIAVARTAFDGDERFADLGALSPDGVVHLPPHAIVTIARTR